MNKSLGKREWSYDEAVDTYRKFFKGKSSPLDQLDYTSNVKIQQGNKKVVSGIQVSILLTLIAVSLFFLIKMREGRGPRDR